MKCKGIFRSAKNELLEVIIYNLVGDWVISYKSIFNQTTPPNITNLFAFKEKIFIKIFNFGGLLYFLQIYTLYAGCTYIPTCIPTIIHRHCKQMFNFKVFALCNSTKIHDSEVFFVDYESLL